MNVDWKVLLTDWDYNVVEEINYAKNKQLTTQYNKAGQFSFALNIKESVNVDIFPGISCIRLYRNGVNVWNGVVWTAQGSTGTDIQYGCVGFMEYLYHHQLRGRWEYGADATDFQIATDLITWMPTVDEGGGLLWEEGLAGHSPPISGIVTHGTPQTRGPITYEIGQNIGEAIQALSDIEAGFNMSINYSDGALHLFSWDLFDDKTNDVIFGYNRGPENVQNCTWSIDMGRVKNLVNVVGASGGRYYAPPDFLSQSLLTYGVFEDTITASEASPNIALALAGEEVLANENPYPIFTITPFPYDGGVHSYAPFVDYNLGDKVAFYAAEGPLNVVNQAVRIFGIGVSISDEGLEQVQALQLTASGQQ